MIDAALMRMSERLAAVERELERRQVETLSQNLRIDPLVGVGHVHLSGTSIGNGATTTFTSLLQVGRGYTSFLSITGQYGDTQTTKLYYVARNSSSNTYFRSSGAIATVDATTSVTFGVALNDTTGVVTITNSNGAVNQPVIFSAVELPLQWGAI